MDGDANDGPLPSRTPAHSTQPSQQLELKSILPSEEFQNSSGLLAFDELGISIRPFPADLAPEVRLR